MMKWILLFLLLFIIISCFKDIEDPFSEERRYIGPCFEELFSLDTLNGYYEGTSYIMYFESYPPESYENEPPGAIERKLFYEYEFLGNNTGYWHYPDTSILFEWYIDRRSRLVDWVYGTECDYNEQILVINGQEMYVGYDTLYKSDFNLLCFEGWTKDYINPYYDSVVQEFDGYYIQAIAEFFQRR